MDQVSLDRLAARSSQLGFESIAAYALSLEEAIREMVAAPQVGAAYELAAWRIAYRALNGGEAS